MHANMYVCMPCMYVCMCVMYVCVRYVCNVSNACNVCM